MRTRHAARQFGFLLALGAFLAGGRIAAAQPPPPDGLSVFAFHPAVAKTDFLTVYGADTPGHLGFGVGTLFSYQRRPFVLHVSSSPDPLEGAVRPIVDDLVATELYGYLGVTKYLTLGLSMPLALYVSGAEPSDPPTESGSPLGHFAWGDVGLHVHGRVFRFPALGLSLGAVLSVTVPTGRYAEKYFGERGVVLLPAVVAEYRFWRLAAAVNLGGAFRTQPVSFYEGTFEMGQQFSYGVAVAYRVQRRLSFMAEWRGRTDFQTIEASPMEVGVAARVLVWRGIYVEGGVDAGAIAGIGTPQFRTYLGVRWAPVFKDSDGDGVYDDEDRCPGALEDRDGYRDGDGCPDPDNDGDGVLDARDRCPRQPEDFDNYRDEDGCPDPDNDGDGVCDDDVTIQRNLAAFADKCTGRDNCPMAKGPKAARGCPKGMLDTDGDGVKDSEDKCPKAQEDKDGFQDGDGCPDPDNDRDGLCDPGEAIQARLGDYKKVCRGKDACPNMPEDADGHRDTDGCPDPDDDGDGVCDDNPVIQDLLARFRDRCVGADRCPGKKETINGRRDTDGCPDRGRPAFTLQGDRLVLRVRVELARRRLGRRALKLIEELAAWLRAHQEVKRLVIVGFTEPGLPKATAESMSQRWADAVKARLVALGLPASRLLAKGLGGVKPVYTGRSKVQSRRRNRRVEFYVVR